MNEEQKHIKAINDLQLKDVAEILNHFNIIKDLKNTHIEHRSLKIEKIEQNDIYSIIYKYAVKKGDYILSLHTKKAEAEIVLKVEEYTLRKKLERYKEKYKESLENTGNITDLSWQNNTEELLENKLKSLNTQGV